MDNDEPDGFIDRDALRTMLHELVDGFVDGDDENQVPCGWGYIDNAPTNADIVTGFANYLMENCR